MPFTTLRDLVAHLKNAPIMTGTPRDTNWKQHEQSISTPGQTVLISEQDWYYWLARALPPRFLGWNLDCFAEGEEPFRFFWRAAGSHCVRQLTAEETLLFCQLACCANALGVFRRSAR